jgi:hypothetical protein
VIFYSIDVKVIRVLQPDSGIFRCKKPASEVGEILDGNPGNVFFSVKTMENGKRK